MRTRTPLLLTAGAIGATAARAAYGAGARALLRRNAAALMAGDPRPLLRMYAPDATLVFPGRHSWGRTYRGRDEIEGFLRRFVATGLQGEIGAVLIDGPPWSARIAVEFADWIDEGGERVYDNRAVLVFRTRFGRIVAEEVYEDTQKVAALDRRSAPSDPAAAATHARA